MNSTIFLGQELLLLCLVEDQSWDSSMIQYLPWMWMSENMRDGYPKINWWCLGSSISWSTTLLKFSAIQNLHMIFGMLFVTYMVTKTTLLGYFRFIVKLQIFIRITDHLFNYWEVWKSYGMNYRCIVLTPLMLLSY